MNDLTHDGLIVHDVPPNWGQIKDNFAVTEEMRVLYAYEPHVYFPTGEAVPFMLVAHEKVHLDQQKAYEGGAKAWWDRYVDDMKFRLSQELPAHRAEYQAICAEPNCNREIRRIALVAIAKKLASPLYGCMIPYKVAKAILPSSDDPEVVRRVLEADHDFDGD